MMEIFRVSISVITCCAFGVLRSFVIKVILVEGEILMLIVKRLYNRNYYAEASCCLVGNDGMVLELMCGKCN